MNHIHRLRLNNFTSTVPVAHIIANLCSERGRAYCACWKKMWNIQINKWPISHKDVRKSKSAAASASARCVFSSDCDHCIFSQLLTLAISFDYKLDVPTLSLQLCTVWTHTRQVRARPWIHTRDGSLFWCDQSLSLSLKTSKRRVLMLSVTPRADLYVYFFVYTQCMMSSSSKLSLISHNVMRKVYYATIWTFPFCTIMTVFKIIWGNETIWRVRLQPMACSVITRKSDLKGWRNFGTPQVCNPVWLPLYQQCMTAAHYTL